MWQEVTMPTQLSHEMKMQFTRKRCVKAIMKCSRHMIRRKIGEMKPYKVHVHCAEKKASMRRIKKKKT